MYTVIIHNGYSASPSSAESHVGGLKLDTNAYNFPSAAVEMLEIAAKEHPENDSQNVYVRLEVTLQLTAQQVMASEDLSKIFESAFSAKVTQRFPGSNQRDRRPAVTCSELFAPLCDIIYDVWTDADFSMTQTGHAPICQISVTVDGTKADDIIALIGY